MLSYRDLAIAVLGQLHKRLNLDYEITWQREGQELRPISVTVPWDDFMHLAEPHLRRQH